MERLITRRETIRFTVLDYLRRVQQEITENPDDYENLDDLLSELKRKEESLTKLDSKIEESVALSELQDEVSKSEAIKEKICVMKARLERLLRRLDGTSQKGSSQRKEGKPLLKLPRLNIEKFFGDAKNWQNFWAQFSSSIHENDTLNKVEKFNYLRSLLGGAAASAISGLPLTEGNYDAAVEIVTNRFGRRDLIINAHMNSLLNMQPIKQSSEVTALRKLYDACEVQIRSLESLGILSPTISPLLCPILIKLIPGDIALEITRRHDSDQDWNLTELLTLLRKEIECRERSLLLNKGEHSNEKETGTKWGKDESIERKKADKDTQPRLPTASVLTSITEIPCIFCKDTNHRADDCESKTVEERIEILRKSGRCFVCLKRNHMAKMCRSRIRCAKCNRRHNQSVCNPQEKTESEAQSKDVAVVASFTPRDSKERDLFMQTVRMRVNNKQNLIIRALLDSGSERTFVKQETVDRLELPIIGKELLSIHAFGDKNSKAQEYDKVNITLCNFRDPSKFIEIEAIVVSEICSTLVRITSKELTEKLEELRLEASDGVNTGESDMGSVDMIIGTDYYWNVVSGNQRRLDENLMALETIFGWSVHGAATVSSRRDQRNQVCTMRVMVESFPSDGDLTSQQLKKFWELDSLGIVDESSPQDKNSVEVLEQFEKKIAFNKERYQVSLPWKSDLQEYLGDNYATARNRFLALVRKFVKNPVFYERYKEVIHGYIKEGIVDRVSEEDGPIQDNGPVHYLPQRAVVKEERSTTKLRIVFDASSKEKGGPPLNDCLHIGPQIIPDLLGLLIRFIVNPIAFSADIESAFLQVEVTPEDREVTRVLGTENPFVRQEELKLETFKLTIVVFGVSSSPFLFAANIRHLSNKYGKEYPETNEMLKNDLYVYDLLSGAKNESEASDRHSESKDIMKAAGMKIHDFRTNVDWWKGPYWLKMPENEWPKSQVPPISKEIDGIDNEERQRSDENDLTVFMSIKTEMVQIIGLIKYSTY